jgi:hypothetical protein
MPKTTIILAMLLIGLYDDPSALADHLKVGGYEQLHPGQETKSQIGAGWGHKSMTFGMMNLMSGMTTQTAKIIRSGKASKQMHVRLAQILDHIAEMMNEAPAYMMGVKVVNQDMISIMQNMLKDLEKMRNQINP